MEEGERKAAEEGEATAVAAVGAGVADEGRTRARAGTRMPRGSAGPTARRRCRGPRRSAIDGHVALLLASYCGLLARWELSGLLGVAPQAPLDLARRHADDLALFGQLLEV